MYGKGWVYNERDDEVIQVDRRYEVTEFFDAVKTGDIETVKRYLNEVSECINWFDDVSQ